MIQQIKCDGKAKYEFLKELAKRSGNQNEPPSGGVVAPAPTPNAGPPPPAPA